MTQTQVHVVGLDAASGQLLWKIPCRAGDRNNIVTPVIVGDRVILTGYQMGTEARRIARNGNRWKAERVWHTREVWSFLSTPVAMGPWLYGYSDTKRGRLYTLNARTGEIVWTGPGRMADHANLIMTPSGPLVFPDDGTLRVYQRGGRTLLSGGYLIVKDAGGVHAWRWGRTF